MIQYYPVIDGLRAIAVLSVIAYHLELNIADSRIASGGYLGVDIFFVISGYLISLIILKKLALNDFSFKNFYMRRARRILPALILILVISSALAWWIMIPHDLIKFSESLLATIVFGSNYYFLGQDSYADIASSFKPLIHTWSLAIEEQFYIIYPLLLLSVWKFCKKYFLLIFTLILFLSLFFAQISHQENSNLAFYALHTRIWEFCLGTLIAKIRFYQVASSSKQSWLSYLALPLLLIPIFVYDDNTLHPSLYTVLPVLATTIIIAKAEENNLVNSILSNKVLTGIGLISYSLYLIHVPALAFLRLELIDSPSTKQKLIVVLLIFLLAYLSWRFIEQPFRNPEIINSKVFFSCLVITLVALISFGFYCIINKGVPQRLSKLFFDKKIQTGPHWRGLKQNNRICFNQRTENSCKLNYKPNNKHHFVLMGDSHMATLITSVLDRAKQNNGSLLTLLGRVCNYTPGLEVIRVIGPGPCCDSKETMARRDLLLKKEPSIIITGGRLTALIETEYFDNQEGGSEHLDDSLHRLQEPGFKGSEEERINKISTVIKEASEELLDYGHKLVLVYPIPAVGWNVPRRFKKLMKDKSNRVKAWLDHGGVTTSYKVFQTRNKRVYAIYDSIKDHPNLLRIYPEKLFCNRDYIGRCQTEDDKHIFYIDDNHLSLYGAKILVDDIFSKMEAKWQDIHWYEASNNIK